MPASFYINVFLDGKGKPYTMEREVHRDIVGAAQDAEEHAEDYFYTVSHVGTLNLEPSFSDAYHVRKAHDAMAEFRIRAAKEARA